MRRVLKPTVFVLALVPLALLIWDGYRDELGANPVEEITHRTGIWGLRLLLLTLAVTPLRRLSGWNPLIRIRRMLGLFAFFYACLHFTTYAWLDHYFSLADILDDVIERPYITIGFSAFVLLIPLALTSNNRIIRWMGGRRWSKLHKLAYVCGLGGVVHYLWLVKADVRDPLVYLGVYLLLMAARTPAFSRKNPAARIAS